MAIVTGPLHSENATKQFGKSLIFQNRRGKHIVKKYAVPTGEPSALQITHRNQFAELADDWIHADPADQESWSVLAEPDHITNYDAYTRWNWARLAAGLETSTVYPPAAAVEHVTVTNGEFPPVVDATGTYNRIADYNGYAQYRRTTEPFYWLFYDIISTWHLSPMEPEGFPDQSWWNYGEPIAGVYDDNADPRSLLIVSEPTI